MGATRKVGSVAPVTLRSIGKAGGQPSPGTSAFSLVVPAPSPLSPGDVLVMVVGFDGNGNPYSGATCSGFTLAASHYDSGNEAGGAVFWKVAGASEPASYTLTATGLNLWAAVDLLAYKNATAVEAASLTGNVTNPSPPNPVVAVSNSVTAAGGNRRLVVCFTTWNIYPVVSAPAGMTNQDSSDYTDIDIVTYDQAVGSGATGTRSASLTLEGTPERYNATSVLVK